jgi:hypothetical protein
MLSGESACMAHLPVIPAPILKRKARGKTAGLYTFYFM